MTLRKLFVFVVLLALAGCGEQARVGELKTVELVETPFFPQEIHQCGPAALATVLNESGAQVTPEQLTEKVYLPGREGSLQVELVAATRGYDRVAYPVDPRVEAIADQLKAGKPVLVLQNLALKHYPAWHYAVVVGVDAERGKVILRSGTTQRLETPLRKFVRSWKLADDWGLVLLKPDELPANADAGKYVAAASGLELAGRNEAALEAYRTALARWPDDATAMLGTGNVRYRQRDLSGAAQAYRDVINKHPRHAIARNNLAQVLLEQGDARAALEEVQAARAVLDDPQFSAELADTEAQIRKALAQ